MSSSSPEPHKPTMLQRCMTTILTTLTDADLIARVHALSAEERRTTTELVASLAEFDARRLYLGAGCSSLFTYCTQVLHLSESAAYARIEAARAVRRYPSIVDRLTDGRLTLTSVCLLSRVMTDDNQQVLLDAAQHKSKRDVELIVARVRPLPAVPAVVRKLPAPVYASPVTPTPAVPRPPAPTEAQSSMLEPLPLPSLPAARPVVRPLAAEIYKVQFTLPKEGHDRLRRAQDLLRHAVPNGDVAAVFERALTLLVEDLERKTLAATARPRSTRAAPSRSRHVPSAIRRAVWRRDQRQCAFVGTEGRCTERGFLELHHVVPFADGGETSVENLQLRCAAHNRYEALLWAGAGIARERPSLWPAAP